MSRITLAINAAISGSGTVTANSDVIEAEATDRIDVEIPADDTAVTVEIQPSASGQLYILLLSSTHYSSNLTYKFSDGSTDAAAELTLDGPQVFSAGNLGSVGVNPKQIKLKMASAGEDATVSIFVARDATP